MIIKKFVGKTEIEATEAAKKELGENMVIMNVKFVKPKGAFAFLRKKQVEVTAALEDDEQPLHQIRKIAQAQVAAQEKKPAAGFSATVDDSTKAVDSHAKKADEATAAISAAGTRTGINPSKKSESADSSIAEKLDNLQTLIESQIVKENDSKKTIKEAEEAKKDKEADRSAPSDKKDSYKKEHTEEKIDEIDAKDKEVERFLKLLYNTMIDNEVDEKYANEIIAEAEKNRKPGITMDFLLANIYQKMILKFGKSDGITNSESGPNIIFFIGPTGVGKTTTIAKVASSFSVNEKKKIALLTTDTYRIAATDQLRTYAGILGVPFRVIYEPDELAVAVEDFADCDYIFVDSAGHSHKNEEFLSKQKEFLDIVAGKPQQIFLVLSATTKYRDLKKIADNYKEISDYQLIFTKLDETGEYGNLYNMRCQTGANIAYVTYGQNVPDDIEAFNAQKTVKQLLGGKK